MLSEIRRKAGQVGSQDEGDEGAKPATEADLVDPARREIIRQAREEGEG